jgi:hypothetical protein
MRRHPRTLVPMDEDLERLLADVADVVLEQGGDWDATFAALRRRLEGTDLLVEDNDLAKGQLLAIMLLNEYEEPGMGPKAVRARRDRRRRLVPITPGQRRGWGWRATG